MPALAVVTWNLHSGRGDLQALVRDLTSGRLTASPIRDYVLLLQEATTGSEPDTLKAADTLRLSSFFTPVRIGAQRRSGNAIMSTHALTGTRVIELPRERQLRVAVAAGITVANQQLFVVSVHLENRVGWLRGGLFSDTARGRQAEALVRALPAGAQGIVGGDMNTLLGETEPAWRMLLQRFPDTPPERPQPTFRERLVLDHLFFDLPDGWRATRQVIRERYGSDDHPVLGLVYQ